MWGAGDCVMMIVSMLEYLMVAEEVGTVVFLNVPHLKNTTVSRYSHSTSDSASFFFFFFSHYFFLFVHTCTV